jgi:hypothetical protein
MDARYFAFRIIAAWSVTTANSLESVTRAAPERPPHQGAGGDGPLPIITT